MTSREIIDLCNILVAQLKLERGRALTAGNEQLVETINLSPLLDALRRLVELKPVGNQAVHALKTLGDNISQGALLPLKVAGNIDSTLTEMKKTLGVMISTHRQVVGKGDDYNISLRLPDSITSIEAASSILREFHLYFYNLPLRYCDEGASLEAVEAGSKWVVIRAVDKAYKAIVWLFNKIYEFRDARSRIEAAQTDLRAIRGVDLLIVHTEENLIKLQDSYVSQIEEELKGLSESGDPDTGVEKRALLREAFITLNSHLDAGLKVRLSISAPKDVLAHRALIPDAANPASPLPAGEPKALSSNN